MRDSDRPMTQREAYQRGYAAGYAAAQSGPPRESTPTGYSQGAARDIAAKVLNTHGAHLIAALVNGSEYDAGNLVALMEIFARAKWEDKP